MISRAANALRSHGQSVDDGLLQYLSPLGWEHINLTGDYLDDEHFRGLQVAMMKKLAFHPLRQGRNG